MLQKHLLGTSQTLIGNSGKDGCERGYHLPAWAFGVRSNEHSLSKVTQRAQSNAQLCTEVKLSILEYIQYWQRVGDDEILVPIFSPTGYLLLQWFHSWSCVSELWKLKCFVCLLNCLSSAVRFLCKSMKDITTWIMEDFEKLSFVNAKHWLTEFGFSFK